jgi:hypothetical protein
MGLPIKKVIRLRTMGWGKPTARGFAELLPEEETGDPIDLAVGGGNGVPAVEQAELEFFDSIAGARPVSLKGQLGEGLSFSMPASVAWAAQAIARQEIETAPFGEGAGARAITAERAVVTNVDFHGHQSLALLCRAT